MRLNLSELDRRYDKLRIRDPARLARVLQSLLAHEQQVPVVVVAREPSHGPRHVLIDGYLRVAALEQLSRDEVLAQEWQMSEGRALALAHRLDNAHARTALEEGWLLHTLECEHQMRLAELAVLLGRSRSWVSRRLGLVKSLPIVAQEAVRAGQVSAQAAQRYLLPLARANAKQCEVLVGNLGRERISVRHMHAIYVAWRAADATTRERIVRSPLLFIAAQEAATPAPMRDELIHDLNILISVVKRATGRVAQGALADKAPDHTQQVLRRYRVAEDTFGELGKSLGE